MQENCGTLPVVLYCPGEGEKDEQNFQTDYEEKHSAAAIVVCLLVYRGIDCDLGNCAGMGRVGHACGHCTRSGFFDRYDLARASSKRSTGEETD
ncbi:hypothetical protein [Butyricicoccus sp.]|uniref:hypothetical protein n=1 Tax=Butyricicoccus sp. TaxID=2049021 RepID=UPI003736D369